MSEELFVFDPAKGLDDWLLEGDGRASVTDSGAIRVESYENGTTNPACSLWCPQVFDGAYHVSFDFKALDIEGWNIIMLCAEGVNGEDVLSWSRSATWYSYAYTRCMRLYTISYSRGDTGQSGIRKLWAPAHECERREMAPLVSEGQDRCTELGKTYHLEVLKQGNRIRVLADGQTIHDYRDDGTYGAPLGRGRLALRNYTSPKRVEYTNFRVVRL